MSELKIELVDLNRERTDQSNYPGRPDRVYLKLTSAAPPEWTKFFHEAYEAKKTSDWKAVSFDGTDAVIPCALVAEEIQRAIDVMVPAMQDANKRYNDMIAARARAEEQTRTDKQKRKEEIDKLGDSLKFR